MNDASKITAIAVDGGGTNCRIAAIADNGCEIVVKGAANAFTDFDGTVQTITSGLHELSGNLSVSLDVLTDTPAYLGLAGVVDQRIARALQESLPFTIVKIEGDKRSAVCAALGSQDGIIAHCGTGSFFGVQSNNTQRFVGGWGGVLDDIASARWMGCRALSLTLYATDGLVSKSGLTESIMDYYTSPTGILEFASHASAIEFGQLARKVSEYSRQNDVIAVQIFNEGAALIADTVSKIGWNNGTLCMTGGLGPEYIPYLPQAMRCCVSEAKGEPLDGAIELARAFSREVSQ